MVPQKHKPTAIVIAGPTASGKTALGIWLARQLGTQILSADSRQCYRELNIGVARPSLCELHQAHHYFIGTHSIFEDVNAGVYAQYGLEVLGGLFKRFPVAVVVGGTGLYIKALCEGVDAMPVIAPSIRQSIKEQYAKEGLSWLQREIAAMDPLFWQQAEQTNPQRLMRGLEFIRSTGTSILYYQTKQKADRDFNVIKIGLELPREILYDRINHRVDLMIKAGLENEVRRLRPYQHLNALQTVGYKEFFASFENTFSIETATSAIKQNTRHYAKRQMTWFKKDEEFHWFAPEDKENILSCIKSAINGYPPL